MPSSSLDRLLEVGTKGHATEVKRGKKTKHPNGWVPGVSITSSGGSVVTEPRESAPEDWDSLLVELLPHGMDPEKFAVDGDTVEVRAWDSGDGEGGTRRLYYFKARVRLRGDTVEGVDLEDIIAAAKSADIPKPRAAETERAYFVQITDLQAGQADGDGIEGMVERALQIPQLVRDDLAMLEAAGKPVDRIFIPLTGDLVEGISGWYEMQTFSVSLDRRDQVKLVRRLLADILVQVAELGLPVHVAVVPGNHGENRQNGKAYTTLGDNDDVAVVEQIAEAFELAGIDTVTFSFPARERVSLTVEVLGHVVGLTHGHIARASGSPAQKILSWFLKMAGSRDPIGDAELLFTGHYHHTIFQQLIGDTWLLQGGALCDASDWFSQSAGLVNDPALNKGTITRERLVETFLPYTWNRTRVAALELAE